MKAINIILAGLAALLLLLTVLTFSVSFGHNEELGFKVLGMWIVNLFLQAAALVLLIISFTRPQPVWARILHSLYIAAILVFYCTFIYALTDFGSGMNFSFGTN